MASSYHYGLGRHKRAVARVRLRSDAAEHTVNGLSLETYLPTIALQQAALLPLVVTSQLDTFQLEVAVSGGGKRGQAQAIRLGIARALVAANAEWHKQLKSAGLLTRDARVKERKKPGLKRARRAPQFSKR